MPRPRFALLLALAGLILIPGVAPADTPGPPLQAGVGRADITPPTGYALGGYTRADRVGRGVHTRLNATAMVLQRGDRKVALVAVDLFMVPGGMLKEAAERNADLGFGEANVLMSASHTHSGPSGFANFSTLNTLAPSASTITNPNTFVEFFQPRPPDPQLYTFLTARLALAIREAAVDTRPAAAAWGEAKLTGITRNRSVEAHLADHGIIEDRGDGRPEQDPDGAEHTIDPEVHVLRVDRLVTRVVKGRRLRNGRRAKSRRRVVRIPMGGWSSFANHGTVVPASYGLYNQDHHGAAVRVFERRVREAGNVSPNRLVVNVYGNGNEGDQSAGLDGASIEIAERVGRKEADAMFSAWEQAGAALSTQPELDLRWTRTCFCGQDVGDGRRVADEPLPGVPFLTGSEEERGPLFDITGVPFEDRRNPVRSETQGHKIGVTGAASKDSVPNVVPLMTVRVGDRVLASIPGEPTVEVGRRVKAAVLAASGGTGVRKVIVSGLANELILYFTTPEEYDRQHYEGGSTLYGPFASVLVEQQLGELARRMARGEPAQDPAPFDPRNGVRADGPAFPDGTDRATVVSQPEDLPRDTAKRTSYSWRGAPRGFDMPLDRPFVSIERRVDGRWRHADDDLWLHTAWRVDDDGRYTATWTPVGTRPTGTHRFVITAKGYRLESEPFEVTS